MKFYWIKRSIRTKLAVFLLLAIAVPMLASLIITNTRTADFVANDTVRQNSSLLYQGKTNLANYFQSFFQTSLAPYSDTTLYRTLETGRSDYLVDNQIFVSLQIMSSSVKEIYQVYLHSGRAERGYLFSRGQYKRIDQIVAAPGTTLEDDITYTIKPLHMSSNYGINSTPLILSRPVITLIRPVYQIPSSKQMGTLALDITTEVIDSICAQLYSAGGGEEVFLLAHDGTIVYGPGQYGKGLKLKEPWADPILKLASAGESGNVELKDSHSKSVFIYESLEAGDHNWVLVKRIPPSVLHGATRQITQANTWVLLGSLLLVTLTALFVSFWITRPIKQLTGYVNQIQSGRLETDIHLRQSDEIGQLARRFRMMMETINNLVLREYRLELANKTNQLKALQAQVHPHFLYNALQSIGTTALQRGVPDLYKLIMQLGKMMRYPMNTAEEFVSISQEIDHTRSYLELQRHRFGDKLTYEISGDPDAQRASVPRMIIQPVVENIFKHAFDPAGGMVHVSIRTRLEDNRITIEIADNGPGMNGGKLASVRQRISRDGEIGDESGSHIGLANVAARLRLHCGENARMELESGAAPLGGLMVTLVIPAGD
ncbi:two-component system, sensor histidine kinase YesM [Paenibacillus sp. RU4T]|uniref:cache domain-containing sensor histidine kinase n=1 Tax=unclassified Paenibacillus TaxID=185978 RepID=UPI000956C32C|nr:MULTISPECIES: sensor histidine kinase [unclassified Paenibacillus]SIQ01089.1 two-component system, sensor histidine kinase YesM [Paenibacillus sp. RU4X]SIQ20304.1 two-component system, sensor histidine kinase YesM [Paenibacillus sp. RU4T]